MPLLADITKVRQQLRQIANARPHDERLVSLAGMLREQLRLIGQGTSVETTRRTAERTLAEFNEHVRERGYEWPPKEG